MFISLRSTQPYITTCEKRPSTGRLISKALPPAPFTVSLNSRACHEFRHSEPNPPRHSVFTDLRLRGRTAESAVFFVRNLPYDITFDSPTYKIGENKKEFPRSDITNA